MDEGAQITDRIDARTAGAVHDFNNLLSVIMVCADEIAALPGDGVHRERAAEIRTAASRGAELIRALLGPEAEQPVASDGRDEARLDDSVDDDSLAADLAHREAAAEPRLSRGDEAAPRASETIDVSAAIEATLPLLERTLGADVRLVSSADGGLPPARLRPDELERILLNLATNSRAAFEAIGAASRSVVIQSAQVAVRDGDPLLDPGWYLRVAVSDNGGGMDFETAARALEPGFSTKHEGTGLGLSIVGQIVREAGGDVRLNTTAGVGTTITFYLPAADEPRAELQTPQQPLSAARGRTS